MECAWLWYNDKWCKNMRAHDVCVACVMRAQCATTCVPMVCAWHASCVRNVQTCIYIHTCVRKRTYIHTYIYIYMYIYIYIYVAMYVPLSPGIDQGTDAKSCLIKRPTCTRPRPPRQDFFFIGGNEQIVQVLAGLHYPHFSVYLGAFAALDARHR